MIPIKFDENSHENLNKDFTEEERKSIVSAAKILSVISDDMIVILGKRMENRRTATTAIIYAKDTFKGQVAERLLNELPPDWKDYLTGGAKDEKGE
jgi:hypothetical protein